MFVPGAAYSVTFAAAQRGQYQNGGQTWQVKIDNTLIGSFSSSVNATNYVNYTANFTATLPTHALRFIGTDTFGGDNTILIDNVRIGFVSPPAAPPAPANFQAVAGDGQVTLSWNTVTFATSYNLKRSTTSGGGYVTIASPTVTNYADTSVTNGMTYYYVVSAVNSGGEGTNSSEVTTCPVSMVVVPLNFSISADGLGMLFNWPADHTGWRLMMNTNNLGDATAWMPKPASENRHEGCVQIVPAFYRMRRAQRR